ncbi:unnamed protein product [Diatraea saccharalis]|uniref:Glyceraldehyde 3-phosphate dehydrogenase NAD(P) binding domain-containing protein n=1 Tax=Diatraea saccharalis TaxID=40085 RepID=A0A9N9R2C7_9NEOP|nr:unnamed protein product [Diatraea saccharalis]
MQLGINGFGRIGRVILRACLQKPDLEVEKRIKIFHEKVPANIPWQTAGVHYVIEASGMFTTLEKASGHLASESVRRVILTAPSVDVFMLILGVNDDKLEHSAPIVKVLEDSFGLAEGFVTSIHAMTPSLKPLDGLCLRGKHWRDHRSIHQNIIPAMTGACKALGKIIPKVKDKLGGLAFRVPIVNVSVLDITIRLNSNTTLQEIIKKVENASKTDLKGIIRISIDNAVSSDFIGETHSCILDADSSLQLKTNFFKLICWYENEYSYACRVIDTIVFIENLSRTVHYIPNAVTKKGSKQHTDCSRKEISSSISQDTGLKFNSSRNIVLKKPLSPQLSNKTQTSLTKRNEFFKIWNEERMLLKPDVRQNRNSFFHSCISITPKNIEQMDSVKAKDRLEMLKKEFSKMVNVTESLLKKSNVETFHSKTEYKKEKDLSENNIKLDNGREILSDCSNLTQNMGDCKSDGSPINDSRNCAIFDVVTQINKEGNKDKTKTCDDIKVAKTTPLVNENKSFEKQEPIENQMNSLKRKLLKTDALITIQDTSLVNKNEGNDKVIKSIRIKKEERDEKIQHANTSDKEFKSVIKTNSSVQISKKLISELNNTCKLYGNIKKSTSKSHLSVEQDCNELKCCEKKVVDLNFNKSIDNKFLPRDNEDIMKSLSIPDRISPERYSIVSDRTSKCGSPGNRSLTISNVETYSRKEDIYDKLDSVSGTDSNNSFQIHERKSQVLDLSDLTTSLEDIGRLDKICKIIEISDELSNKLFAALDSTDEIQITKKKWSFKDLCEKIKLDDFCDTVFGKSSI